MYVQILLPEMAKQEEHHHDKGLIATTYDTKTFPHCIQRKGQSLRTNQLQGVNNKFTVTCMRINVDKGF